MNNAIDRKIKGRIESNQINLKDHEIDFHPDNILSCVAVSLIAQIASSLDEPKSSLLI